MKTIFISIFLFLFCSATTFAYLDPASGSMILQVVLAFIAGIYVMIKVFWSKIKKIFIWKK